MAKSFIKEPDDTQRIAIIGATGSGKTNAGLWHLSRRNFDVKPWIIYDFKGDATINAIPGAVQISVDAEIPRYPGLYIVRPHLLDVDDGAVEAQMWAIWERQNVGVFVDEALVIGRNNRGYRTLLTQGRSLHVPMIICTQRPSWIDVFTFSEADFFQVFRLQSSDDIKSVEKYVPHDLDERLPKFHSYYYNVGDDKIDVFKPTPDSAAILDTFAVRMARLRRAV